MSTAIPPLPSEAVATPALSEPQRIINTFVAPSKTFADIRRNPGWWVPWLLVSIVSMAFFYTVEKKVGFDTIVNTTMEHAPAFMQQAMESLTPEQRQQRLQGQITGQRFVSIYLSWLTYLILGLIAAALYMVAFNFVLEAGIPYKNSLAVFFYGMLPKIFFSLLAIIVLIRGVDPTGFNLENPINTNVAAFLDRWNTSRFLYHLLSFVDVFTIWSVILLGIGYARQSAKKISTGTAITTVAVVYFIGALIRAVLPF